MGGRFTRLFTSGMAVAVVVSATTLLAAQDESTFMRSHRQVLGTMEELRVQLESVKDAASAKKAAKELPAITDRFVAEAKGATALYLSLSEDEQREAQKVMQEELIAKVKEGKLTPKNDLVSLMVEHSKGPHLGALQKAIEQMRDTLLDQRSIYVPVTARERIAKTLGAKGSPLPK